MVALGLKQMWLVWIDLGVSLSAPTDPAREQVYTDEGEVRTYASGRQRSITVVGERGSWSFTLLRLSLDNINTLRTGKGYTVLARDHRGQSMYGVYHGVTVGEWKIPTLYTASITLQQVTVVEGV